MGCRVFFLVVISCGLLACGMRSVHHVTHEEESKLSAQDPAQLARQFAKNLLQENLRERFHIRAETWYLEVQMIFETDGFLDYTSYSNTLYADKSRQNDYTGFLLFAARYESSESAQKSFQALKSSTQIRISELQGMSGILVEQVQIFEKMRKSGGLLAQKGKYVFYLLEHCEDPPTGDEWDDFEKLFLQAITNSDEKIEVINADCGVEKMEILKIKAT